MDSFFLILKQHKTSRTLHSKNFYLLGTQYQAHAQVLCFKAKKFSQMKLRKQKSLGEKCKVKLTPIRNWINKSLPQLGILPNAAP